MVYKIRFYVFDFFLLFICNVLIFYPTKTQTKKPMKNLSLIAMLFLALFSCKESSETKVSSEVKIKSESPNIESTKSYPENVAKIFETHGGLDKWNQLESLVFEIESPDGNEKTTTTLKSRKSLIETKAHTIGYNGEVVWLKENDTTKYKGNAKFYYNLMFYFYAMPFVLADDGISYKNVEPLTFDGKTYPGIQISYGKDIGESPEDEYILYYDEATNKMAWLGYTVTYFSKEKSKDFHFIKYDEWQTVNGFTLPSKLQWYNVEGFKIGEKLNDIKFVNISVSKSQPKADTFERQVGSVVVE